MMNSNILPVFTTQKLNNTAAKLSYTPYQLELLNSIYRHIKYPNSVQKTLIAKCIGITRDQVKIWFQNRRRKDTINKDKNEDVENKYPKSIVACKIIENVLNELKKHKNAPSRLSSKRTKSNSLSNENMNKFDENLNTATQLYDSQVLKKTTANCIIDLNSIINATQPSISSTPSIISTNYATSSSSEDIDNSINYLNIEANYENNFQISQKSENIKNYLQKKYYSNYYYNHNKNRTTTAQQIQPQHQQQQVISELYNNVYNYQYTNISNDPNLNPNNLLIDETYANYTTNDYYQNYYQLTEQQQPPEFARYQDYYYQYYNNSNNFVNQMYN